MRNTNKKHIRSLIFKKYNGKCAYCGTELNLESFTIDHINPKFRGFSDAELNRMNRMRGICEIDNYNPSCFYCNSSKSTMTLEKWRSEISLKYDRLLKYDSTFRLLNRFNLCKRNDSEIVFYFEKL